MAMVMRGMLLILMPLSLLAQVGPYAPQAGVVGSDAIPSDSAIFRDWASTCTVQRGLRRIDAPDSGFAVTGNANFALGPADPPAVVSLGDSGVAVLTFSAPFFDGPGADFAVFENGFLSDGQAFLELAFVEVSSNGVDFFRFKAISETPTDSQLPFYGVLDASYIHNLAGKYISRFGVPFDLSELPDTALLDKSSVTHVRIVDVIGSIDASIGSFDSEGIAINDPWPTTFEQSGFDLDAVGIIHSTLPPTSVREVRQEFADMHFQWYDLMGTPIEPSSASGSLPAGIYLRCIQGQTSMCEKVFIP